MDKIVTDLTCGTFSGVGYCISSYIFDTIKVRQQMNFKLTFLDALRQAKADGWLTLFNGIYYPFVTIPIVNAVVFSAYEIFKKIRGRNQLSFWNGAENGAFAGFVNTFVLTPVQLIKCKMQMRNNKTSNKIQIQGQMTSRQCLLQIVNKQGIIGLFRGFWSTAFRQVFGYSAQFSMYELLKNYFLEKNKTLHLSLPESITMGAIAGISCWVFSYPQDVIKTHIQLQQYSKIKQCSRGIYLKHGLKGFWVGIVPCLFRAAFANAIGITIYQQMQQAFGETNQKNINIV